MKKVTVIATLAAGIIAGSLVAAPSAQAGSWCNNGTYSSNSGRGTCSWNGGVNNSFPSYSDPGSSSWNRNNFNDPFKSNRNSFGNTFGTKKNKWR